MKFKLENYVELWTIKRYRRHVVKLVMKFKLQLYCVEIKWLIIRDIGDMLKEIETPNLCVERLRDIDDMLKKLVMKFKLQLRWVEIKVLRDIDDMLKILFMKLKLQNYVEM